MFLTAGDPNSWSRKAEAMTRPATKMIPTASRIHPAMKPRSGPNPARTMA